MGNVLFLVVRSDNTGLSGYTESISVCASRADARIRDRREVREAYAREEREAEALREASDRAWAALVARRSSCEVSA